MKPNWNIRIAMAVLAVLIAFRPGIGGAVTAEKPVGNDLEVLLVVDETLSMSALDYNGARSRLEGVRDDLTTITKALPYARFGLIGFGHDAKVDLAFTDSRAAIQRAITGITREPMMAGTGTTLDRPLDLMTTVLAQAQRQHPDRRRVVIFLSDGENTKAGAVQRSFAVARKYVDDGAVLGYGTSQGGRMPTGGEPPWTFVRNLATGQDARSRIDETNLRKIAGQLGVDYAYRGGTGSLTDWAVGLSHDSQNLTEDGKDDFELYWILAIVLAALALVELRLDVLAWREAKEVAG
ncbi:vWA domain-containing protein [Nocardioides jiangxiensis]|uniref:VWA domain-containing protein n=1 Tax=Nocardioides jiangxiensis TaxID=3064524 RepID=A0ABT9B4P1_9ACTN|nr:VWA domain-containing protein [Nocardioides sp. WY-20]MDO7869218.1 VWA domain-containing protein [Nocardioides sp. WY-20]